MRACPMPMQLAYKTSWRRIRISRLVKSSMALFWLYQRQRQISHNGKLPKDEIHYSDAASISSWRSTLAQVKFVPTHPVVVNWMLCGVPVHRGDAAAVIYYYRSCHYRHSNEWYSMYRRMCAEKRKTEEVKARDKFVWMHREQGDVMCSEWRMPPTQFIVHSLYISMQCYREHQA